MLVFKIRMVPQRIDNVPFKKRNDSSDIFSAKFQKSIEEEWIKMNMQQH